jgi:cytochrome c biogenesis protein CcdA
MVIGLLRDQVTYYAGFGYLLLYNLILIVPLIAVLWVSADKILLQKMEEWKRTNTRGVRIWAGIAMLIIGTLIFFM